MNSPETVATVRGQLGGQRWRAQLVPTCRSFVETNVVATWIWQQDIEHHCGNCADNNAFAQKWLRDGRQNFGERGTGERYGKTKGERNRNDRSVSGLLKITSRLNTQNRDRAEQEEQRATDDRGRRERNCKRNAGQE